MNTGEETKRSKQGMGEHVPVLLEECMEFLHPEDKGLYGDLTLGGGGHATSILELSEPGGILFGLDQDPGVLEETREKLKSYQHRINLKHGNFSAADSLFEEYVGMADGVIMDLGLSSFQLDRSNRGFAIFKDGPLDFRMDTTQDFKGRDLVNNASREELLNAIGHFGEEPKAKAIVKAIMEERKKRPLLHTSDIRNLVERVYGRKGGKIHPATLTFQGLRMAVNKELESLEAGLTCAFNLLRENGRLCVISFHSGEDRVVKGFAKDKKKKGLAEEAVKKPIQPGPMEIKRNRRSRSARLRVIEKTMAPMDEAKGR